MNSYKAPIAITVADAYTQMLNSIEKDTMDAVAYYKIKVDKEELLKALAYDREQYEKGYGDGYRAAKDEIVRCKDCKNYGENPYGEKDEMFCKCWTDWIPTEPDDFCSYGERKENND